jgi:SAM-dependent methyltransferase
MSPDHPPPKIDLANASPSRVYNALRGGSGHYLPDRSVIAGIKEFEPGIALLAARNRAFLGRVVRYLTAQGVTQFLDLGCGLPERPNVHEIAWETEPAARVVYIDNDPNVLANVHALVSGDHRTAYLEADVRDVEAIWASPQFAILDPDRPIGFLAFTLLHFLHPADDPAGVVDWLGEHSAPGGYLALSHLSHELLDADGRVEAQEVFDAAIAGLIHIRTRDEIAALLGDRELVEPGLVPVAAWRPDEPAATTRLVNFGAVAHL